jgi:serine phosphatase RsbU (regulator of sigma subunit)
MIGIIFSEGLTASINSEGNKYPFENIKKIIKENWAESPTILVRKIFNDYNSFINEKDQFNDVSIIIIQY